MFPDADLQIKIGVLHFLVSWNLRLPYRTILYDYKFVGLTMIAINAVEKIRNNALDKKHYNFIKGELSQINKI